MSVPKDIWIYWHQGWDAAPPIVVRCLASWRQLNPAWRVRALSAADVAGVLPDSTLFNRLARESQPLEAVSDVLRVQLLSARGGVWADSTTYCLAPLDTWLPAAAAQGFFAFDRPRPDRLLSSWFLAAHPATYLIDEWRYATEAYWEGRPERDHYFWFHRLFESLYAADDEFRRCWDQTPKISASGPHAAWPCEETLATPPSESFRALVERRAVPLLKLTHKVDHDEMPPGSTYHYLCRRQDQAGIDS